jgi:hypothetical protein
VDECKPLVAGTGSPTGTSEFAPRSPPNLRIRLKPASPPEDMNRLAGFTAPADTAATPTAAGTESGGGAGRGLHSSTLRLNISTFGGTHASTFRLDVSTSSGLYREVSLGKVSQVELRSGRLLWHQ